jgi:hypothetical protein
LIGGAAGSIWAFARSVAAIFRSPWRGEAAPRTLIGVLRTAMAI